MKNTLLAIALLLTTAPVSFAYGMASLVDCRVTTSSRGRIIYVGTYEYQGQYLREYFDDYCPSQIRVESVY